MFTCPKIEVTQPSCPEARFDSLSFTSVTNSSVSVRFSFTSNMPGRLCYAPASNPTSVLYTNAQTDNSFGAPGNPHNQTVSGLDPNTEYLITSQTSEDGGATWIDISCPTSVTTTNALSTFINPVDFPISLNAASDTTEEGNWNGVLGATPAKSGDNSWTRVTIEPNGNYGASRKLNLTGTEAWISYCIRLGSNWTPTSNVKLPGFSAQVTGGGSGGQGGEGSGGSLSWSSRMIIQMPGTAFVSGGLGYEVYHDNSSSAPFGEPMWWGNSLDESGPRAEASIADGNWHCITQHIKLNDAGQNNGIIEGWLDGNLLFQRTDLGWTDNPTYQNIAFWFNVFHGGAADTSGTSHDIFFDCVNYSIGDTNQTQCLCNT